MKKYLILSFMIASLAIFGNINYCSAGNVYYDVPVNTIRAFNDDIPKAIKQFESHLLANYRKVEGDSILKVFPFEGQTIGKDDIFFEFRVISVAKEPMTLQNAFGAQNTYMVPKVRYTIREKKGNGEETNGEFWRTHSIGGAPLAVAMQLNSANGKNGVRRLVKWSLQDIATDLKKLKKQNALDEKANSYM